MKRKKKKKKNCNAGFGLRNGRLKTDQIFFSPSWQTISYLTVHEYSNDLSSSQRVSNFLVYEWSGVSCITYHTPYAHTLCVCHYIFITMCSYKMWIRVQNVHISHHSNDCENNWSFELLHSYAPYIYLLTNPVALMQFIAHFIYRSFVQSF